VQSIHNSKLMSSISLRNIFLRSIPRPMTWHNALWASNLANLGITCNFLQPHPAIYSVVGELGMRWVRGYQCRSEFDAPGLDYILPSASFVAFLRLNPVLSFRASYDGSNTTPTGPSAASTIFQLDLCVSITRTCGQCHSDLVSIIGSVLKYGCKQKNHGLCISLSMSADLACGICLFIKSVIYRSAFTHKSSNRKTSYFIVIVRDVDLYFYRNNRKMHKTHISR